MVEPMGFEPTTPALPAQCSVIGDVPAVALPAENATLSQTTPSASGATILSATQLVDDSGTIWTLTDGLSYENGVADGGANVTLLLYYNTSIYANTTSYGWWWHASSGWTSIGGDPRATARNGTCGSSNGADLTSVPTGNLCSTGTASSVIGVR